MRSARNLHPEWGYLAPAPTLCTRCAFSWSRPRSVRAPVRPLVVALVGQSASNDGHKSMAAHALVTSTPVISRAAASPKAAKLIQAPAAPSSASASAAPAEPAATSTSIPIAVANGGGGPNKAMSSANAPVSAHHTASAGIRTKVGATAASAAERGGTTLEIAPEKVQSKRSTCDAISLPRLRPAFGADPVARPAPPVNYAKRKSGSAPGGTPPTDKEHQRASPESRASTRPRQSGRCGLGHRVVDNPVARRAAPAPAPSSARSGFC
jgi:hypothetical protein